MPSFNPVSDAPVSSTAGPSAPPANTTGASTSSFLEVRFPTNISYGAVGGCDWSTRVQKLDSGWDYRQAYYAFDRGRWTITHKFRNTAEWNQLISFFRNMNGRLRGFRFQDPTDYTYETFLGSGISAGVILTNPSGQLQFYKAYSLTDVNGGNQVVNRPIFKPAPDQPITITSPGGGTTRHGWTLNCSTGVVTGGGVTVNDVWIGQFDVPVRFDADHQELTYDFYSNAAQGGGVSWLNLPVVEVFEGYLPAASGGNGASTISEVKSYGVLSTRWHLNGAQAKTLGSLVAGGANNINSVTITSFSPNGGLAGGYAEPNGIFDNYFFFAVYEALSNTAAITSVTDSVGGQYSKWFSNTVTINNAKTLDGSHTYNVPFNLDVWYRNGQIASPQTGVSVTANFGTPVDSVVAAALAFSGSPYPTALFDTQGSSSGTTLASGTATPQVTGINTSSNHPLVICALGTFLGDGTGGTNADALAFNASPGTYDSNDFTDGGFGHTPPYWSGSATNHSGTAGYLVGLNVAFTQVSGPLIGATAAWNTFTAANLSPGGWIVGLGALRG